MELQIGIDEFSRALYRAQGIVEKKSTMPILASVLLEATTSEEFVGAKRRVLAMIREETAAIMGSARTAGGDDAPAGADSGPRASRAPRIDSAGGDDAPGAAAGS